MGEIGLRLTQAPSPILPHSAPAIPAGLAAGLLRSARLNLLERVDGTDLRWESRVEERRREGAAACGNTGSFREAERDCRVPLDLHRHSGCLEGRGEALCVSPCT